MPRLRAPREGRHPLQTSDALGAAGTALGPRATALAVWLHKGLGVPLGKVRRVLATQHGLAVTRGGLVHLCARTAARAAPTYAALCAEVRGSPVVTPDETGWKVGGVLHWLGVAATPTTTVFRIAPGRGFDDAAALLGADFAGILVRTGGWSIGASRRPRIKHVWRIFYAGAGCGAAIIRGVRCLARSRRACSRPSRSGTAPRPATCRRTDWRSPAGGCSSRSSTC